MTSNYNKREDSKKNEKDVKKPPTERKPEPQNPKL